MGRQRIDTLLVKKGLADSREKARLMVMEGAVIVGNRTIVKPSTLVADNVEVCLLQSPPFVGRGGLKLERALDYFNVDVTSSVVVDIGASTGGFTDCVLKRGAERVYAIDVGYGQLDYRLRQDPRVVVMERVNARYPVSLPEMADLAIVDVSFISVEKIIPSVAELVKNSGKLIILVKPQFEAGRHQVGKGGIIRDPRVHAEVLGRFINWSIEQGFRLKGLIASPILGAEGNREFLTLLSK